MESNVSSSRREDTARGFLKLPPKSRSPSRGPLGGSPSRATDTVTCTKSPGSGSSREVIMNDGGDEASQDGVPARVSDWRGLIVDTEQESKSQRLVSFDPLRHSVGIMKRELCPIHACHKL